MARKKTVGIYKMTHDVTKQFYIGSSTNCEVRSYQHKRSFVRGTSHNKLQEVTDLHGNHWTYEVIQSVPVEQLVEVERTTIDAMRSDPLCLNSNSRTLAPIRGHKRSVKDGNAHARGLLGKNLKDHTYSRPEVVTFVSPDGKVYKNVRSVKRFARQHGLSQPLLNSVALGQTKHHKGWRLPTTPYDQTIGKYKQLNVTVVSPEGKEYTVNNLSRFVEEHGLNYQHLRDQINGKTPERPRPNQNTDIWGRSWHIPGRVTKYTITDVKTGEVFKDIVVLPVFASAVGADRNAFRRVLNGETKKAMCRYTIQVQGDSQ